MLLQDDPVMVKGHLAHLGDLLSRFCCNNATVLNVLEMAELAS